ncbi:unnamed protein product [Musa acuminata subsp. malaccensis]|uniref:(wild Malaysian banana) hypothetical protein n=1 Tax=Musa acuminata subsp. malaccensis TaxID=214687 RepID=A0A804KBK2_MUSAM|nr:PREDICTED: uncharacterized protein LOC103996120 isoform X1 [Musa acuminata subsp. malaccensis]XP_009415231.1 PREDICTED: uncharacterized protein LOC103996120 isoform X1 [Musa acuminata subsp. malaccensis]CAG1832957.1 unnamed protein product [Musa acuminata subsp. malaccensis]
MEVDVKELNTKGKECVRLADGKNDADECNHFTIRGYVAGVRKRDARICWPLFMPDNESSDILANMLPPLHVSKFKRWSCLNCIHMINASADATGNADSTNVQHKDINIKKILLNDDTKRLCFHSKECENIVHGERLVSNSCNNVSHVKPSTALYCGKKETGSTTEDAAREGTQIFICEKFRSEENQDQTFKPALAVAEGVELEARETQTRNIMVTQNKFDTIHLCDDVSPLVSVKPNRHSTNGVSDRVLIFGGTNPATYGNKDNVDGIAAKGKIYVIPDGMPKECRNLVGVDLGILRDDALTATAANVTNYDFTGLDQSNNEASYGTLDLSDGVNCSQNQNSLLSSSHEKVNHKKARKLRLLEDILKSEELHVPKKVCAFKGDAETCEMMNSDDRCSVGTNFEAQTRNCKSNLASRNSEVTTANPVNGAEADQSKDEEVTLLHWLKKVSKKFVTDDFQNKKALGAKGSAEIMYMEKVGISPSTHNEKDANPLPKRSGVSKQKKCYSVEKENKVPQVKPSGRCLISQKENLISKIAMMKHVCPDNVYPKMRNMISAPGKLVRSCDKKANFNRRKKKASQVEDRNSLQINWSRKGVVKKRRTTKMHEKEALDDIPMDIVELLARNQHERSLTNAEIASKKHHELSIINGEIRSGNISCVSEYCGSKDTNALYKSNALVNDTVHDVPTASCGKQNADHGTEAYNCAKYQKHILIDLNQQATEFPAIPAYDGHQSSTTHIPVVDPRKTHSLPSSCGRIRMQDFGSYQKDGVSAQSSAAGTHDMLSAPVKGRKYGISSGNNHAHCNYGKMVPYDSVFDRNQNTVVKTTDYQEPVMLTGSHILNAGGKSEQSTNRTTQPTTSCTVGGGNRCHSGGTGPMDLSNNDMISALHLLRLVDQAALTGTSWDINRVGIAQNSNLNFTNQSTQVPGVKNGVKIREAHQNSVATGYSAHNQNEGNFSRPHRPVPRVGVLGSLLQKEIMTRSNKCVAPLGCGARWSGELPSFFTEGIGRTDASSSANHTEYGDHSSQLSVTASTKTIVKAGDSPVHKFEMRQVRVSKNNELIQSVRHDCTTTNCIVNRNPADFSIPDEDNIYMRGFEDVSSKCPFPHKNPWYQTHHDGKKWQTMKLPVLKGP